MTTKTMMEVLKQSLLHITIMPTYRKLSPDELMLHYKVLKKMLAYVKQFVETDDLSILRANLRIMQIHLRTQRSSELVDSLQFTIEDLLLQQQVLYA